MNKYIICVRQQVQFILKKMVIMICANWFYWNYYGKMWFENLTFHPHHSHLASQASSNLVHHHPSYLSIIAWKYPCIQNTNTNHTLVIAEASMLSYKISRHNPMKSRIFHHHHHHQAHQYFIFSSNLISVILQRWRKLSLDFVSFSVFIQQLYIGTWHKSCMALHK